MQCTRTLDRDDIDHTYRIGSTRSHSKNQTRPLIVVFLRREDKISILRDRDLRYELRQRGVRQEWAYGQKPSGRGNYSHNLRTQQQEQGHWQKSYRDEDNSNYHRAYQSKQGYRWKSSCEANQPVAASAERSPLIQQTSMQEESYTTTNWEVPLSLTEWPVLSNTHSANEPDRQPRDSPLSNNSSSGMWHPEKDCHQSPSPSPTPAATNDTEARPGPPPVDTSPPCTMAATTEELNTSTHEGSESSTALVSHPVSQPSDLDPETKYDENSGVADMPSTDEQKQGQTTEDTCINTSPVAEPTTQEAEPHNSDVQQKNACDDQDQLVDQITSGDAITPENCNHNETRRTSSSKIPGNGNQNQQKKAMNTTSSTSSREQRTRKSSIQVQSSRASSSRASRARSTTKTPSQNPVQSRSKSSSSATRQTNLPTSWQLPKD
ncbi:hypothetical protein ACOMHN_050917 [Nucella lapillus]